MSNATFGHAQQTLNLLDQQKLSGEEMNTLHSGYLSDLARAIKSNTLPVRDVFQKFLGLLPVLKVWGTIRLGLHKTPKAYASALKRGGTTRIGDWAQQILHKISISQAEIEVDLCVMSVAELGFKKSTRYDDICARIVEVGGQLCPNEVGPALRDQYKDQPDGECLVVAMEPLTDSDGSLRVFVVNRFDGEPWLGAFCGCPDSVFVSVYRFVFVLPRK
ncbi:MAG: hypothetical protein HYX20_02320 [Candidatus Yanofskybacteria bacterium]|nr:hypothetical protein [Candidatus Yanofskybacteria bacterium]